MHAEWGMFLVGSCYNFVWVHRSLGEERTPAMAAGLTDHRWRMEELLAFPVPPAELPRWRGRKPRWLLEIECAAYQMCNELDQQTARCATVGPESR